jgi:hypothetical protein
MKEVVLIEMLECCLMKQTHSGTIPEKLTSVQQADVLLERKR